jgi:hypothetical protein
LIVTVAVLPAAKPVLGVAGAKQGVVGPGCGAGAVPTGQIGLVTPEQSSTIAPAPIPAIGPQVADCMATADPVVMSCTVARTL